MNTEMKRLMSETIRGFHLPRYHELPNMGLYLEQTVKYLNLCLAPLRGSEVTASMVSNYVKKGLVPKPEKKQYYADHIAYLFFVVFAKNLLSMENIALLIRVQQQSQTFPAAYDYLCDEMENVLFYMSGLTDALAEPREPSSDELDLLRDFVFSVAHTIQLNLLFSSLRAEYTDAKFPVSSKEKP